MINAPSIAGFDMTNIKMKVAGRIYSFAKAFEITSELGALCRTAEIIVADADRNMAQRIHMEDPIVIECDELCVLTGYITDIDPGYDAENHDITITAASKTCDLVDCSALVETTQMIGLTASEIIQKICDPFGIKLRWAAADDFPTGDFQFSWGDSCGAIIENLCRRRNLVYTDDENGNLVITDISESVPAAALFNPPSDNPAAANILSGLVKYGSRGRFSEYIVVSQDVPTEEDESGEVSYSQQGNATDEVVRRYRPLVIVSALEQDAAADEGAAELEKMRRIGESNSFEYSVNGWKSKNPGTIWMPGRFVSISDVFAGIAYDMVVKGVVLSVSAESGRMSRLSLCPPQAVMPKYKKIGKKGSGGWGSGTIWKTEEELMGG